MANQIVKLDLHNQVAINYKQFDDPKVQQQILWMLAAYVMWPKTYRILQESVACMELFQYVIDHRNDLVSKLGYSSRVSLFCDFKNKYER